jgi:hypothetical protein
MVSQISGLAAGHPEVHCARIFAWVTFVDEPKFILSLQEVCGKGLRELGRASEITEMAAGSKTRSVTSPSKLPKYRFDSANSLHYSRHARRTRQSALGNANGYCTSDPSSQTLGALEPGPSCAPQKFQCDAISRDQSTRLRGAHPAKLVRERCPSSRICIHVSRGPSERG